MSIEISRFKTVHTGIVFSIIRTEHYPVADYAMMNNDEPLTLKAFIEDFCKQNQVSICDIACHADMSRTTIYAMMGDAQPTVKNLCKLAIAMQVHPNFLLNLEWQKCRLEGIHATPIKQLSATDGTLSRLNDHSHFISETYPDGSLLALGERFTKTWRLQNTGDVVWQDRKLVWQNPYDDIQNKPQLQAFTTKRSFHLSPVVDSIDIPTTHPGDVIDLSVELIAPDVPASAFSYWKMTHADGTLCFPDSIGVYVQIQTISAGSAYTA